MADTPWEEVPATTRIWLRLKQAGVKSVEDLSCWTAAEILAVPGLHKRSLQEIEAILAEYGLSLRAAPPKTRPSRWSAQQLQEMLQLRRSGLTYAEIGHRYGISHEWAKQLLSIERRHCENKRQADAEER